MQIHRFNKSLIAKLGVVTAKQNRWSFIVVLFASVFLTALHILQIFSMRYIAVVAPRPCPPFHCFLRPLQGGRFLYLQCWRFIRIPTYLPRVPRRRFGLTSTTIISFFKLIIRFSIFFLIFSLFTHFFSIEIDIESITTENEPLKVWITDHASDHRLSLL